jgi:RimJ/RimL family protein N-acetyltransferase
MINRSKVRLRNKRLADARNDYEWQRDPELAWLDATTPLRCTFEEFRSEYASELHYPNPSRRSFAVETAEGRHIGNCVYYNIDESRGEAELGIMIGDRDYWDKGYGTDAVRTLVDHVFRRTRLRRLYLKTLVNNTRAQKCFRKCHFTPCGYLERDGFSFLLMELDRSQWQREAQAQAVASQEQTG